MINVIPLYREKWSWANFWYTSTPTGSVPFIVMWWLSGERRRRSYGGWTRPGGRRCGGVMLVCVVAAVRRRSVSVHIVITVNNHL